ncbi:hypothetical protein KAR91_40170, partial [Candidatus Pacearchaeota archaeon]|nr:hypothetical protein [Candidatus Pacearchaeota archaeon]
MKRLKTLFVIVGIMVGISNTNGAYVISSFKDLIPEITPAYTQSMGMDYNPVTDSLMVRDPNTGADSIVSNIG